MFASFLCKQPCLCTETISYPSEADSDLHESFLYVIFWFDKLQTVGNPTTGPHYSPPFADHLSLIMNHVAFESLLFDTLLLLVGLKKDLTLRALHYLALRLDF